MATPQQVVQLLNAFLAADPTACRALVEARVPCGPGVEAHPTLVPYCETAAGPPAIGLLGVVNGIVGLDGEIVHAVYDAAGGALKGFRLGSDFRCPVRRMFETWAADTQVSD